MVGVANSILNDHADAVELEESLSTRAGEVNMLALVGGQRRREQLTPTMRFCRRERSKNNAVASEQSRLYRAPTLQPYTDDSEPSSIAHTGSQPAMRPMIDLIYSVLQRRPLPVRSPMPATTQRVWKRLQEQVEAWRILSNVARECDSRRKPLQRRFNSTRKTRPSSRRELPPLAGVRLEERRAAPVSLTARTDPQSSKETACSSVDLKYGV